MAQVTMTGKEYADLLRQVEQGAEIIRFLKEERKIKFTEDNIRTYSAGEFPNRSKFPEELQDFLVQDMVQQLLHKQSEEFSLWALTDCHYYNPKSRDMTSWSQDDSFDLLEYSPALKERWDLARTEYHSGNKEDNEDGE